MEYKNRSDEELIRQLYEPAHADAVQEALEAGQQIIEMNPAPAVSDKAKAQIRLRIARELELRRSTHWQSVIYRLGAVAAAVVVIAALSLVWLSSKPADSAMPSNAARGDFWESSQLPAEIDFDIQFAQLEDTDPAQTILLESNSHDASGLSEMQGELQEMDGSFWEG